MWTFEELCASARIGFEVSREESVMRQRFPLPSCDIETGAENTATARIILDEVETSFGICQALVTIEGRPEDWSIVTVEVPTDVPALTRYGKTKRWFREDWETVSGCTFVEREILRAVREAITEDMATDALGAEMGE